MLSRLRQVGLVWPTIFTIVGLAVLVSLGNWQWQRMYLKEDLIDAIAVRTKAEPVAFDQRAMIDLPLSEREYLPVVARGVFDHSREKHVYAASKRGQSGWHIFTPLIRPDDRPVWVNRGFVPDRLKELSQRKAGQTTGTVEIRGLVRVVKSPGYFVPDNDPATNIWYWPDVFGMQRTAFPNADPTQASTRTYIDAERSGDGWPRGGTTVLRLENKHFGYALTWFGLALTLIGVFLAFALQRLRPGDSASASQS